MTTLLALRLFFFLASAALLSAALNRVLVRRFGLKRRYLPVFAWGVSFYLVIYLLAAWIEVTPATLRAVFSTVSVAVPLIALLVTRGRLLRVFRRLLRTSPVLLHPATRWGLAAIVVVLGIAGIYLEFPSDPVSHLERIQGWEGRTQVTLHPRMFQLSPARWLRFAYFLYHWQLHDTAPLLSGSPRLGLLAAVMAALALWCLLRFTALFTTSRATVWLAGIAALGLFGHNLFSFFRYYPLSPGFWAYLVFVEAMILMVGCVQRQDARLLAPIPALLPFLWLNHPQEILLLYVQAATLTAFALLDRRATPRWPRRWLWSAAVALTAIAVAAAVLPAERAGPLYHVGTFEGLGVTLRYPTIARFYETLGIGGGLAMLGATMALVTRRTPTRLRMLAAISFGPLAVLSFPPAVTVLTRWLPGAPLYRLLYGSMYWIFLVLWSAWLIGRLTDARRRRMLGIAGTVALLALMVSPTLPVRGRLPHLLTPVDPRLDGRNLEPVVRHLLSRSEVCATRTGRRVHGVLSGAYVNAALRVTGRFRTTGSRWDRLRLDAWVERALGPDTSPEAALERRRSIRFRAALSKAGICHVVIYREPAIPDSWPRRLSGHWQRAAVTTPSDYPPDLLRWIASHPEIFVIELEAPNATVFRVDLPRYRRVAQARYP